MNQDVKKQLGIYVHIPFCVHKCVYCDFLSVAANESLHRIYCDALIREIRQTAKKAGETLKAYQVKTIFFGGGTPSCVDEKCIYDIMSCIREVFELSDNAEISIECNPGTLTQRKAKTYRNAGFNRISFGLQSTDDEILKKLGRIHDFNQFKESFAIARNAGFDNINVDVMSALPGQTVKAYEEGLERVLEFELEHISAYSLILEEGTYLYDNIDKFSPLPDEDKEREMYYKTADILKAKGYYRYEISNYSKPGYECRHNISYWQRKDYLGFGVGAASLFQNERYSNLRDIETYVKIAGTEDVRDSTEFLSANDRMAEFMFLGLRMSEGISFKAFKEEFGTDIKQVYGDILAKHLENNLLENTKNGVRLSAYGVDVSNAVMAEYLMD